MSFGFHSTAEEVTNGVDLTGQSWLITGVNSGLGYETARVLAQRGATIVGAARTEEKARAALDRLGITGHAVACELADLESVNSAIATVKNLSPLAGIIANAGIMALPTLHQQQGVELQFFVNHVGHFVLVNGLVDRVVDGGRIAILSSEAHRMADERGLELDNLAGTEDYAAWRMYGRSKLANILFARELDKRLERGIRANSLHPGVIATNLARHVPNAEAMYDRFRDRMKTVGQGAATQCYVAVSPEVAGVGGTYFSDCAPKTPIAAGDDDALAATLWEETEILVSSL